MKNFTSLVREDLKHLEDTDYCSTEDIVWEIGTKGSLLILMVVKNTPFNVSVPKWLTWLVNPHNTDLLFASALHDEALKKDYHPTIASGIFMRALRARGMGAFKSWLFFHATLYWTAV